MQSAKYHLKEGVTIMLLRSLLFVPGNNEKLIAKAENLSADIIIYDLEDAVSLEEKETARNLVKQALTNTSKSIFVRINAIGTDYFEEDVHAITQVKTSALKGIVLPKSNRSADVETLEILLHKLEAPQSIKIIPLLESALGVHNAVEIGGTFERVQRLAFGSVDFALDIQATLTKEGTELLYARSQIVMASRVQNLQPPIDTVFIDFKDTDGLLSESQMVKNLGFGSKLAIHPDQIEIINETFSPSQEEIEEAKRIMEIVKNNGTAVFQLDGKMIDEPIIKKAERILNKLQ